MHKTWVVTRKEWAEVFKNRFVLFTIAFLPLMLTAFPLGILYGIRSSGDAGLSSTEIPSQFTQICEGLVGEECAQYYLVSTFLVLYMLLPLAIPVTIAAYSIVGEKATRTLEPVLATPISTLQLLGGKALAASIPAILVTWLGFGIFAIGVRLMSVSPAVAARLLDPVWLVAVFIVGPLLALAAVSVAVMVSSRVNDPRVAEQVSMLVILPLLGLFFGQIAGLVYVNERLILLMAGVLVVADVVLSYFATQLFERETILTRWK
jgi:ABC-2 type transport system permease protein